MVPSLSANDNEMGCDGGHSTPAPFPCAPPMTTVTGMAMALAVHTPDDDNTGCDRGIPPPAPCTLGDGITPHHPDSPCHTSSHDDEGTPYQRRFRARPQLRQRRRHGGCDGGSATSTSPSHPCCPLLAPSDDDEERPRCSGPKPCGPTTTAAAVQNRLRPEGRRQRWE
ncbi:hypothetical protein EDB85DRAFT_2278618 [Lactarius pseudohatsudake]|nr:hypothetical protein EDB85DRAFT_2278618 [Lactarius pseudohatsudake]